MWNIGYKSTWKGYERSPFVTDAHFDRVTWVRAIDGRHLRCRGDSISVEAIVVSAHEVVKIGEYVSVDIDAQLSTWESFSLQAVGQVVEHVVSGRPDACSMTIVWREIDRQSKEEISRYVRRFGHLMV